MQLLYAVNHSLFARRAKQVGIAVRRRLARIHFGGWPSPVSRPSGNPADAAKKSQLNNINTLNKMAALQELGASLTHELSQPLTAIMANAEASLFFLRSSPPDLPETIAALEDILEDDRRAASILQKIRVLLKSDPVQLTPLDLNQIVREAMELAEEQAKSRSIQFAFHSAGHILPVVSDRVGLTQAVFNLMVNALESGGIDSPIRELTIRTFASDDGAGAILEIEGSGGEPSFDSYEKIFEPLRTVAGQEVEMLLPVSRAIIRSFGGELSAVHGLSGRLVFRASFRNSVKPAAVSIPKPLDH